MRPHVTKRARWRSHCRMSGKQTGIARLVAFAIALVLSISWLIPAASPRTSVANAQQLGEGYSLAGVFKGTGGAQIATLYDPSDDLGLRIVVLERTLEGRLT